MSLAVLELSRTGMSSQTESRRAFRTALQGV